MKMKMNKNKTMLALVLVAALALCSVAVIADAQQSDADDVSYSYLEGNYTVKSTDSSIFVYGGAATVTVPATVTYSGTISFGYYNPNGGFTVATDSIVISGASDLKIVFNGTAIALSGNYAGDVTLAAGSVMVETAYNGSIIAGDAKFVNDKSSGLIVTLKNGKACMSGTIAGGKVTVTGTAYVDAVGTTAAAATGVSVDAGAELVIATDATVDTMPWSATTFDVTFSAAEAVDSATKGTPAAPVPASDISGKKVTFTGLTAGTVPFTVTTGTSIISGSIVVLENGKCSINSDYAVDVFKNKTATYDANTGKYYVNVMTNAADDNAVTATLSPAASAVKVLNGCITFELNKTDFSPSAKTVAYALSITMGTTPTTTTVTGELKVVADIATDGTYSDGKSTLTINQSVVDQTKNGKSTVDYNQTNTDSVKSTIDGKLTVDGTFNVNKVFVAATTNPVAPDYFKYADLVVNTGAEIFVNGMMMYQSERSLPATGVLSNNMNATMYFDENTSTLPSNVVKFTYYFTTISNALSNSASVTVYGKQVIENDMTLETGVSGEEYTEIDLVGALEIGVKADPSATPVVEGKTVIVTVPEDTTTINFGSPAPSHYYGGAVVQNGQLRFTGLETDSYDEVIADVFISDATYGIYTDLATALDMAVSGDSIEIRDSADPMVILSKNTEVKDGVELTGAAGKIIYVPSGIVFTISGEVDVEGILVLDYTSAQLTDPSFVVTDDKYKGNPGVLNLNTFNVTADYIGSYAGTLNFTSSFDNTDDSMPVASFPVLGTEKFNTIVNVDGKYTMSVPFTNMGSVLVDRCNLLVSVTGQLTVDDNFDSDTGAVYTILNVTGTVDVVDNTFNVSELNATGSAKIIADEGSYLGIYVEGFIGDELKSPKENTNAVEASVATLGTSVLTVYGKADKVDVYDALGADNAFLTKFFVDKSILYETVYYTATGIAMTLPELEFDDYESIVVWYADPNCETVPVSNVSSGDYEKLYGKLEAKEYTLNFDVVANADWYYNNKFVGTGDQPVTNNPNGNTLKLEPKSGYELKDPVILVNGQPMPDNYVPASGDKITFSGEVVEKGAVGGMDLITILLIIITVVIIIMAIIIALKLLRS